MPPAGPSDHGRGQEQIHIAVTPVEGTEEKPEELPLVAEDIGTVSVAPATPPTTAHPIPLPPLPAVPVTRPPSVPRSS
jgi:hypothetical protein